MGKKQQLNPFFAVGGRVGPCYPIMCRKKRVLLELFCTLFTVFIAQIIEAFGRPLGVLTTEMFRRSGTCLWFFSFLLCFFFFFFSSSNNGFEFNLPETEATMMMKSRGAGGENTLHRGSNEHPFHPGELPLVGVILFPLISRAPRVSSSQKVSPNRKGKPGIILPISLDCGNEEGKRENIFDKNEKKKTHQLKL